MTDRFLTLIRQGWTASRIVALYVLIGSAWILLSDRLIIFNAPDPATATLFSTVKGLGYVAVTAGLLHWLINLHIAELRVSEERFRVIFEHANDAIHIDNADDKILDVNPRMCELMGYSRDELLTMRIPDLQVSEFRGADSVIVTELARHGDALFESLNLHRSGQRIPVEISVARVARPGGDLYVSVIRDITDRKHAEEKLRQTEAFNQALIDHSPLGISVRSRTGQLLFANTAWRKIWAISESDLRDDMTRQRDALQFDARDDYLKPYQADLRRVYEHGGYLHLPELKTTNPRPGAAEWVAQHFYAIVDERGQVDRMVILTEDVSDRKRAQEALRESEEQFRSLVEQSPLSTQVLSPEGWTLQVNHAFETLWGITLNDLENYNILSDQQLVRLGLMPYIQRGFSGEATSIPPAEYDSGESVGAGDKKWVQARIYPVRDEAGNIRQVTVIHEDISERKRAEEALLESEARLRQIASTVHEVFWLRDTQTLEMLYVNPAYETVWGRTCASLYTNPTSFVDAVHSDDKERVMKAIAVQRQTGTSFNEEYRIIQPDNSLRWVWGRTFPIKNEAGQVYRIAASVMDITERRRAEDALRESEERYRLLVETSPDPIFLHQVGRFVFLNPAACKLLGAARPDELIGRPITEVIHPDYHASVADRVRTAQDQGQPVPVIEEVFLRLDDSPVDVEVAASSLLLGGQPTMQVIARDITDRKQHEREIAAIAAVATALRAAATRDDMIPVIVRQVYSLLNADGAALIRREPVTGEAVIVYGQGVGADLTGLRIPRGSGIVGHVMDTGRSYLTQDAAHDPYTYRRDLVSELRAIGCAPLIAQNRVIGALWAGRATTLSEEEVRLLSAVGDIAANALHRAEVLETLEQRVYDRTRELAEANERLTELDRLKSKFVSDVSHELRTPITSLMLNVELLDHGKPEKREHYLQVIRQQTARQVQLIEDILNLSRLELSTARAPFAPVNVNALVEQAVSVYRSSAEAANLSLNFTPDPGQPVVMAVESHLSQVVTNLIANAINYTPAGSVEVATQLAGREVVIEVRDTGLGIAAEDMPYLFDRFYRGKLTWQVRGSGLGLAIVKEITEVHKGRVEVDSQAGVGSTFRVYLPIV